MSDNFDAMFDKIATAQATRGGNYAEHGKYRWRVENLKLQTGDKGTTFVMELRAMTSAPCGYSYKEKGSDKVISPEPTKAGNTASIVPNLTKHKSAPGNVKAFLVAAIQCLKPEFKESDFSASFVKDATSDAQPLRGLLVDDDTYPITIQSGENKGLVIVGHGWRAVPQTAAALAASRLEVEQRVAAEKAATETAPSEQSMGSMLEGLGITK